MGKKYIKVITLSKELEFLILNTVNKSTSNICFEKLFENTTLDWSKIYLHHVQQLLIQTYVLFNIKLSITTFSRYKTIHYRKNKHSLVHFVTLWKKLLHIFSLTAFMLFLWERLQTKFQNNFILPSLTPQTAILGLYER